MTRWIASLLAVLFVPAAALGSVAYRCQFGGASSEFCCCCELGQAPSSEPSGQSSIQDAPCCEATFDSAQQRGPARVEPDAHRIERPLLARLAVDMPRVMHPGHAAPTAVASRGPPAVTVQRYVQHCAWLI